MRAKPAPKRTMMTAAETMDQARPLAAAMVERAERQLHSRMAAYERVASVVGVSPSWLRKLIGRQPGVTVEHHEFYNLAAAYRAVCARIEGEAELERQRFLALGRTADAALTGTVGVAVVDSTAAPPQAED